MIELKIWALILAFAVPMIASPGPGNTVLAASGGKFGVRGTVPFWLGFEAGNVLWCLVYGFGLSQVLTRYPLVYEVMKWGGTLYVLYLAWCFFQSSAAGHKDDLKPLRFIDGLVSLSLNVKVHSMILVMFSQFLNPSQALAAQVLQMTLVFLLVGLVCHFAWIYGGHAIFSRFTSARALRNQGLAFGLCMVAVAGFTALT